MSVTPAGDLPSRLFRAVTPKMHASNLPAAQREGLVQIVHQGASICGSYRELATYIRAALARLHSRPIWSVAVARDLFVAATKQPQSTSTLSVPALLKDLGTLARGASSPREAEAIIAAARASRRLAFTVLVFAAASSDSGAAPPAPLPALAALTTETPLDYEVLEAHTAPALGASAARETALAPALRLVGSLQRGATALDSRSEAAFCTSLRGLLNRELGSTWHLFLTPAPDKGRRRGTGGEGSSAAGGGADDTLGGRVAAAALADLIHSSAHAPGYDVTWDSTPPQGALSGGAGGEPRGGAGARSAAAAPEELRYFALALRSVASGPSASASERVGETPSSAQSAVAAPPKAPAEAPPAAVSANTGATSAPPRAPAVPFLDDASGEGGAVASAAAAAAAEANAAAAAAAATPDFYHLVAFRTTQPQIEELFARGGGGALGRGWLACGGACRDTSAALDTARIALYAIGAVAFATFLRLRILSTAGCAREGRDVPWGIAALEFIASFAPRALGVALDLRSLLPPDIAAANPRLWPASAAAASLAGAGGGGARFSAFGGDAAFSAAAADAASLPPPPGCTLAAAHSAELASGACLAALYLAVLCLLALSGLRWMRKTHDAARLKSVLRSSSLAR